MKYSICAKNKWVKDWQFKKQTNWFTVALFWQIFATGRYEMVQFFNDNTMSDNYWKGGLA